MPWDGRHARRLVLASIRGVENNAGTFLSQQADARGALVEKIVNSVDAVLTRHAHERGDFARNDLPESMFVAGERYFGIHDGKLHNISPGARSQLAAESVQVVFTGERRRPTITVVDQGEGQSPDRFPGTFLSLSADNKRTIPFVQGKFNMGSAGAVPFCGTEHHYQLILSRRHPCCAGGGSRVGIHRGAAASAGAAREDLRIPVLGAPPRDSVL